MMHRKIKHVMTKDVIAVDEHTDFKDIVRTLAIRRVSAVPVVDSDKHVVGVVSNADLLAKQAQFEPAGLLGRLRLVRRYRTRAKASATVAADLMTAPAITIDTESSVVHGARLLAKHDIDRLPVVDENGRLAGIVSRQDLLSVFLRGDKAIRNEIIHDVFEHGLGVTVNPTTVDVTVHDGLVTLAGELETKSLVTIAEQMCRRVDGVVDVSTQLRFITDDTHLPSPDVPIVGATRVPRQAHL